MMVIRHFLCIQAPLSLSEKKGRRGLSARGTKWRSRVYKYSSCLDPSQGRSINKVGVESKDSG